MKKILPYFNVVHLLKEREIREAEKRIGLLRGGLLAVCLFVFMPIQYLSNGRVVRPSMLFETCVFAGGLIVALVLAKLIRSGRSALKLGYVAIVLDMSVIALMLYGHTIWGFGNGAAVLARYDLTLALGFVLTALSGLRLSVRQVLVCGFCCFGLVAEVLYLDVVYHHAALEPALVVVLSMIAGTALFGAWFLVTKTHDLMNEAASMEAEAARVKGVLSRYVSTQVAETVLQEDLSLNGGQRQRVTLMFTDIRGFTKMSETMPPEQVVSLLNSYFQRMVGALFAYDGMLDKYIGDGMMAVFGAPIRHEDHAKRAIKAALRMRQELDVLNQERLAGGLEPLRIGIGIHTGDCVIGNIGTEQRLDYTAIGDTVNTASRIESLTKEHAVDILMSAETFAEVEDWVEARRLPDVAIRGKAAPLDLYVLEGIKATVPTSGLTSPIA